MSRFATIITLAVLAAASPAAAQDVADRGDGSEIVDSTIYADDEVDAAVDRAIAALVKQQRPSGEISDSGHRTTMTALAVMSMASVGIQPNDGTPEGDAMAKALAYVLRDDRVNEQGYFGKADGSRMYGHGIITLMLTEMLGMGTDNAQDRLIHERAQAGVDVILASQAVRKDSVRFRGGWRYEPTSRDADLSVSVWQVMALRSAKNDGLQVPARAIRDAVAYLERSYASEVGDDGMPSDPVDGFTYTPDRGNAKFTMTAAGLLAMQVCGEYDSPLVAGAADWLLDHPPKWRDSYCCYGTYYYAQGMYQRGGKHAGEADRTVRKMLLGQQRRDGLWEAGNGSERGHGRTYATSLAVLSLSVKYHYLPIYQR